MSAQGEDLLAWLDDDRGCTAQYPGGDTNPYDHNTLCNHAAGHDGNHRALAEVAGGYRRYVVWATDGTVLPDEETHQDHPRVTAAGPQTSPMTGDQLT